MPACQTDVVSGVDEQGPGDPGPAVPSARPRRRARRRTPGTLVLLVLAAGLLVVGRLDGWSVDPSALLGQVRPEVYVTIDGRAVAVPEPALSTGRPLAPVEVTTQGSHAFLHLTDAGHPVGYDPCRPVTYVVRADGAPPQGDVIVADAVAIISAASGLAFVPAGATDEAPALDRLLIQPERYGDGWVPVLVAWSDASEVPELAGQVAGVGGSAAVPGADGAGTWLAAGRLVLDGPDLTEILAGPGGFEEARAIVVHELAHVVGLDHVADPGELMNPTTSARTDLGPGDLQGLALVGRAACQ